MNIFLRATRIICFLIFLCMPCLSNAQGEPSSNWWENNMVTAKGYGLAPKNVTSLNQARNFARRAAIMDGYRMLAEQVKGVHITAETTIKSQILSGDIVESRVSAIISGAEVLSEEFGEDGSCVVVVGIPVYGGANSIANVVFKPVDKENFPRPTNETQSEGNYTGLIIDCGDLDLKPVLSPVIRNADNQSIYSCNNLERDKLIASGMVGYATNQKNYSRLSYAAQIKNKLMLLTSTSAGNNLSRAGNNPLIIKATRMSDDNSCPVVSVDDADKILTENQASHFLDNGSVVFTSYRVGGIRV
ncbi:MAG: LPP20 family lipoprotein [Selenomonadaceae bacterium]|nr:LPP20 family lipoprotein [Selenomonadaceae bacterium]